MNEPVYFEEVNIDYPDAFEAFFGPDNYSRRSAIAFGHLLIDGSYLAKPVGGPVATTTNLLHFCAHGNVKKIQVSFKTNIFRPPQNENYFDSIAKFADAMSSNPNVELIHFDLDLNNLLLPSISRGLQHLGDKSVSLAIRNPYLSQFKSVFNKDPPTPAPIKKNVKQLAQAISYIANLVELKIETFRDMEYEDWETPLLCSRIAGYHNSSLVRAFNKTRSSGTPGRRRGNLLVYLYPEDPMLTDVLKVLRRVGNTPVELRIFQLTGSQFPNSDSMAIPYASFCEQVRYHLGIHWPGDNYSHLSIPETRDLLTSTLAENIPNLVAVKTILSEKTGRRRDWIDPTFSSLLLESFIQRKSTTFDTLSAKFLQSSEASHEADAFKQPVEGIWFQRSPRSRP